MTPAEFVKERKALVKSILAQVKPFFWASGYVKHPATDRREYVQLWVPRDVKGKYTEKSYSLKGGMVLDTFEGFTDEGVITDGFAGGLVTTYWEGIPIEDLYRLNQWMLRMMPKLTVFDQQKKAAGKAANRASRNSTAAAAGAGAAA